MVGIAGMLFGARTGKRKPVHSRDRLSQLRHRPTKKPRLAFGYL
jgi:hypothetical protein